MRCVPSESAFTSTLGRSRSVLRLHFTKGAFFDGRHVLSTVVVVLPDCLCDLLPSSLRSLAALIQPGVCVFLPGMSELNVQRR